MESLQRIINYYEQRCKKLTGIEIGASANDLYYDAAGISLSVSLGYTLELRCEHKRYSICSEKDGFLKIWIDDEYYKLDRPNGV